VVVAYLGTIIVQVLEVFVDIAGGGVDVVERHHRVELRVHLGLDVDLVEVGLIVAEGLSDGDLDDAVGGGQRLYAEELPTALVLEGQSAPQHRLVALR
jgi:hypothetical protein